MSNYFPDVKWPVRSKARLVIIDGLTYTVYNGRTKLVKFKAEEPMNDYWVERLRSRPEDMAPIEPKRSA